MLVASSRLVCMLIQETPQNCHIRSWELASIVFAEVGSGTVLNWLYGFKKMDSLDYCWGFSCYYSLLYFLLLEL